MTDEERSRMRKIILDIALNRPEPGETKVRRDFKALMRKMREDLRLRRRHGNYFIVCPYSGGGRLVNGSLDDVRAWIVAQEERT